MEKVRQQKKESLRDVLKACRDFGVLKISFDGYAIEFGADPNQPVVVMQEPLTQKIGAKNGAPTEDELLYWSADKDLPDIEAETPL